MRDGQIFRYQIAPWWAHKAMHGLMTIHIYVWRANAQSNIILLRPAYGPTNYTAPLVEPPQPTLSS